MDDLIGSLLSLLRQDRASAGVLEFFKDILFVLSVDRRTSFVEDNKASFVGKVKLIEIINQYPELREIFALKSVLFSTLQNPYELDSCGLCREDFVADDKVFDLSCHHIYHSNCISNWLNKYMVCPYCLKKQD